MVWFRRDLRSHDHAALHHALSTCRQVFCLFVLDREILDKLPRTDRRVDFIVQSLTELDSALHALGKPHGVNNAGLLVVHDWASTAVPQQAQALQVQAVFTNHDDEPQALQRDAQVASSLAAKGLAFHERLRAGRQRTAQAGGHHLLPFLAECAGSLRERLVSLGHLVAAQCFVAKAEAA